MRIWSSVACCVLAFLLEACGGNGGGTTLPSVQTREAGAVLQAAHDRDREYVAIRLPSNFVPSAIMKDGNIPGSAGGAAVIYRDGMIHTLGTYRGKHSVALFVNSRGDAVGYALSSGESYGAALLFSGGRIFNLGHLPDPPNTLPANRHVFNKALVIDDRGTIYGFSDFPSDLGGSPLVRYSITSAPELLTAAGSPAGGVIGNVNSRGRYSVEQVISPPIGPYAGVGSGLAITQLFGQRASAATWINDRDEITGFVDPVNEPENDFNHWNGFIQTHGTVRMLPSLPGFNSTMPLGINDSGEIIGTSACANGSSCNDTVFVYRHGRVADLRSLVSGLFASGVDALPGISNDGEFLVRTGSENYVIKPAPDRD